MRPSDQQLVLDVECCGIRSTLDGKELLHISWVFLVEVLQDYKLFEMGVTLLESLERNSKSRLQMRRISHYSISPIQYHVCDFVNGLVHGGETHLEGIFIRIQATVYGY